MAQPIARPPMVILGPVAPADMPGPPVRAWENKEPAVQPRLRAEKPNLAAETVFTSGTGRLVLFYLTLPEQERFKCVAKRYLPNIVQAQHTEYQKHFPKEHLKLVTGNLDALPMRLILQLDNEAQLS